MDYDALTNKCDDLDSKPVTRKSKRSLVVRSRTHEVPCCGRKCFIVTVVALFLFVTFVSLPAGIFLILHGERKGLVSFKVGGGLVVSIPIVAVFGICLVLFFCRKTNRTLTFANPAVNRI